MRRIIEIVGGNHIQLGFGDDFLAELNIRALEPNDKRHLQSDLFHRRDHPLGDDVAAHDAAENIDQNSLHFLVGGDDFECRRHLFLGCAAADIEKVGGFLAIELDDVHRCHGETGAVHHAADRAVERDVGKIVFGGLDLL